MTVDSPSPSIALAAFTEALVDSARVLVVGSSESGLAEHLLERGARLVHVCDADPTRTAESVARNKSRNVSIAPLSDNGLGVRDGAFDVAIIENLAADTDAPGLLRRIRRALAPRGVAVIASPNADVKVRLLPDAGDALPSRIPDYYELYDAVAAHFDQVTMLGQTPFVGYAIANFAPENDPVPLVDTAFVPGGAEEPEWFVAVASSDDRVRLEDFSVVQLPFRNVLGPGQEEKLAEQLRTARHAEQAARTRMAELEVEVAKLQNGARERESSARDDARVATMQSELDALRARSEQLESSVAVADARVVELEAELETARTEAASAGELARTTAAALEETTRAFENAQSATGPDAAPDLDDFDGDDVARLERALVERSREVRRLETELREAERVGRELVLELAAPGRAVPDTPPVHDRPEAASPAEPPRAGAPVAADPEIEGQLRRLAAVNAEREADLQALKWTLEELENRLAEQSARSGTEDLNKELDEARAEIQRQAVLIEQLRRPPAQSGPSLTRP